MNDKKVINELIEKEDWLQLNLSRLVKQLTDDEIIRV